MLLPWKRAWGGIISGIRSASESRLGVAECDAGVPGAEKSREGEGDGLVKGVWSEELREEKSITSPFSSIMSECLFRLVNLIGVEDVLLSKKPAASFWALLISLASWVRDRFSFSSIADSTGLRLTRFLSPSTVMIGSIDSFEPVGKQAVSFYNHNNSITMLITLQALKKSEHVYRRTCLRTLNQSEQYSVDWEADI